MRENLELQERIKQARNEAGLSQESLAKLIGVTRSAVAQWEGSQGGKYATIPRKNLILKLSQATNKDPEWFFEVVGGTFRQPKLGNIPTGWACPSCRRIYSPMVTECPRCR